MTPTPAQLLEIETVAQRKLDSGVGSYVVQPEVILALVREARRAGRYREALQKIYVGLGEVEMAYVRGETSSYSPHVSVLWCVADEALQEEPT